MKKIFNRCLSIMLAMMLALMTWTYTDGYIRVVAVNERIGTLSSRYEARGGVGTISTGSGDSGGKSYGAYQFASNYGIPKNFFNWCISSGQGVSIGNQLKAAYNNDGGRYGSNFDSTWRSISNNNTAAFEELQYTYTKMSYYDSTVSSLQRNLLGFNIDNYSIALKNVIWSRSVHHGATGAANMILRAFKNIGGYEGKTEAEIINAIYDESGRIVSSPPYSSSKRIQYTTQANKYGIGGKYMKYYSANRSDVQIGVYVRLNVNERRDALNMIGQGGGNSTSSISWTDINENYVVDATKLNFRENYNTSSNTIKGVSLYRGDIVYVNKTAVGYDGRTWASITYNGVSGYCCMKEGNNYYLKKVSSPSKPNPSISPGNSQTATVISWNTCSNTNYYELKVYNSSGTAIISESNLKTTSKNVLLPSGSYSVEVTAVYDANNKTSSGRQSFSISKITPEAPTVKVSEGTSDSNTNISWNSCKNADSYELKICYSDGSTYKTDTTTGTSYSIKLSHGKYYVAVTSKYAKDGTSNTGKSGTFTVVAIPSKPTLTVTAGDSNTATMFSWNSCTNTDKYKLVIYNSDGTTYKSVEQTGTSYSITIGNPGNYYAIVIAINTTYNKSTSSEKSGSGFTVKAVPSKPNFSVLAGNNFTETAFSWNACDYTNNYKLDIYNTDTGKLLESKTLTATSYSLKITTPGNYKAIVTAQNTTYGTSTPSNTINFVVEDVTVGDFTVSVAGKNDSAITLKWTESNHATKYDVYRSENGEFTLVGTTSDLTFTDAGLYIGTEYTYYVTASNDWTSKDSKQVTAATIILTLNGNGTEESPYLISSVEDLQDFTELINNSETNSMFNTAYYEQTADINLTGMQWTPIGTQTAPFQGHYNGNYCSITGLDVSTTTAYAGFFGYCGKAVIKNTAVYGNVSSTQNVVGGIAAEIGYGGRIENCAFYGDVNGANYVGGIVGNIENGGTLVRCYHIGAVSGTANVGGIAGEARVGKNTNSTSISISYCYHAGGNITGTSKYSGIVGLEDIGTAKTCTISYQDCYYLKTNASSGVNGTTNAGVVAANETVFKTLAITLGEPYTDGTAATNYYPVFVWESEHYTFKGQGTSSSPYQIGTVEDLQMLSEYTNDQYLNVKYGNAYYVQTADLDLNGIDFVPIGTEENPFNGLYNGGYRTISNLTVSDKTYGGLFGCAETIGIKNLVLNGSVDADYAGGIAGRVTEYADLTQIAASVEVSGTTTGGLIGRLENSGKITDSYQCGAVSGSNAGGLIGAYITESTSPESLVIRSSYHGNGTVGDSGIIGTTEGETSGITLENCYYLKDTASTAVNGAAFSGATTVNATVLKALAVTLEGTYVDNTDTSLNSGYPVFAWQLGRYEFAGSGTEEDPYLIGCAEDLIALQEYVNDPSYNAVYGTAYYKQTADIDLGDMEWTAIGMSGDLVFNGVYDGDYFTVYGLNASGETYSGLFGQVGASSSGRNAGVYNVIIKYGTSCSATGVTGGAAAVLMNGAIVDSCGIIGDLTGDTGVGGVVGIVRRSATISNSYYNGSISGNSKVGGILGTVESGTATIANCYHTGGIVDAEEHAGAIVGYVGGAANIENSYYINNNGDNAVDNTTFSGATKVNSTVLKALAVTLGDAYIDNVYEEYYNDGYPILKGMMKYDGSPLVIGDIDLDDDFDVDDAILLQDHLLGRTKITEVQFYAADVCIDGSVVCFDLCVLKRMLVESEVC